jgi:hypothetical protein
MRTFRQALWTLLLSCCLFSIPAGAVCRWIDGSDPAAPGDPGRGVSDWQAHFNAGTTSAANVPDWIASRFATLQSCLSPHDYARLYADASVMIAHRGRQLSAWLDGSDQREPGDPGRGVSDWHAHFEAGKANGGNVVGWVRGRLVHLQRHLPPDAYAHMYADLSILIANYAR